MTHTARLKHSAATAAMKRLVNAPLRFLRNRAGGRLIAPAVLSLLLGFPLPALHAAPIADPTAPIEFRPGIGKSGGGVPVVNITEPNRNGLSHNRFQGFDVGPEGVILNNSAVGGGSLLGGAVAGNPNVKNRSARIIINEVVRGGRGPAVDARRKLTI